MQGERPPMEAVLGDVRGRLPGVSRVALVPLVLLAVVFAGGLCLLGYRLVGASGAFAVERVEVSGAGPATQAVQNAVTTRVGGSSMLDVDPTALAASLSALPRVRSATVDRAFPHTLAIHVVPERAVAIAPTGDGRVVLSATGRVMGGVTRGSIGLPMVAAAPSDIQQSLNRLAQQYQEVALIQLANGAPSEYESNGKAIDAAIAELDMSCR